MIPPIQVQVHGQSALQDAFRRQLHRVPGYRLPGSDGYRTHKKRRNLSGEHSTEFRGQCEARVEHADKAEPVRRARLVTIFISLSV